MGLFSKADFATDYGTFYGFRMFKECAFILGNARTHVSCITKRSKLTAVTPSHGNCAI